MASGNDVGDFLRARRDAVSPREVGLPVYDDRRVVGLRREEVALLAAVSADYYTRLEQGREKHPSRQVLEAIARALRLDAHSTAYLFGLATSMSVAVQAAADHSVSPELQRLMSTFVDVPAVVVGPALDILSLNPLARALYRGFDRIDNQIEMVFMDPAGRSFYVDWEGAARSVVSNFRAVAAPFRDDPRIATVVGEAALRSPTFASLWAEHEVRPRTSEDKVFCHPDVGELHLHYQAFTVTAAPGQQLFVYTADPGSTSVDALEELARMPLPPRTDLTLIRSDVQPEAP